MLREFSSAKSLILLTILAMAGDIVASETVNKRIEQPFCEETVSTNSILRSIELSDTATEIHFSFVYRPKYWCRLDYMELVGNNTGKVYNIKRADGYRLGEKKYMPASGRFDFTVTFQAIDSADTAIDIVETDENNVRYTSRKNIDLTGSQPAFRYTTHITGTYEGTAGYVGVMKSGADRDLKMTWIPVDNGKFKYTMYSDELIAYDIINGPNLFMGSWDSGTFFSENADISIDFMLNEDSDHTYGLEHHDISIEAPDGSLTTEYMRINDLTYKKAPAILHLETLKQEKKYYIPEYYNFAELMKSCPEKRDSLNAEMNRRFKNKTIKTAEGAKADSLALNYLKNERVNMLCDIAIKMNNLAGLYAIVHEAYYSKDTKPIIEAYLNGYAGKYPESEYAIYMDKISGTNEMIPGMPFNDFSANDLEGNRHVLSTLIEGRPALLDLWASWCGPCRRTCKSMIPVYEEYAAKGFTIVGVAREYTDSSAAAEAIKKDGYKWLNLVEIDDAKGIWALYRRHNAAGGTFLISPDGKIVKSDVTAEEVRNYLKNLYGDK